MSASGNTTLFIQTKEAEQMLKIITTDDYSNGRGHCLDCGYSCQANDCDSMDGYESALNHALNENHRVVFRVEEIKEVKILMTVEEDTVNLGPQ
jgi:hypothetical protein